MHVNSVEYFHEKEGKGKFKITVITSTVRADRVFFDVKFETPVTSIEVTFQLLKMLNGLNSAKLYQWDSHTTVNGHGEQVTTKGNHEGSNEVPQIFAIYDEIRVDPMSEKAVEFTVNFPEKYYSTCLEILSCRKSKRDDEGYKTFFEVNLVEFREARVFHFNL